ncbi:MAG: 50S ribosomal protein L15 [Candidatus Gracilibacteria bacterium]|nr:50S ribosomal protein L15 [Candidatus Gracilibacteria bacterium]MDD3119836.1 50S ribosomal protein L15 [Candidatus Gracilibacteria bacterium]MDD4530815.1 50S ribosomal protein L15 [Candidatus Gracilibacteria bacterium]
MFSQNNIKGNQSARKSKRVGRGNSSGKGTFCGRGCKGQNARAGSKFSPTFEGGQTSLFMRMPKRRGFRNPCAIDFVVVNVSALETLVAKGITEIDKEVLLQNRVIRKKNVLVKLLGNGEIKSKVKIKVDFASKSAIEKVNKAGGEVEIAV